MNINLVSTRHEKIEEARELVCDHLTIPRDSLAWAEGSEANHNGKLLALAAALVMMVADNNAIRVDGVIASIREVLHRDYEKLGF